MFIMKTEPGGGPGKSLGKVKQLAGIHFLRSHYKTSSISRLNQVSGKRGHAPFLSQFRAGGHNSQASMSLALHAQKSWPAQVEGISGAAGGPEGEVHADPKCKCLPF